MVRADRRAAPPGHAAALRRDAVRADDPPPMPLAEEPGGFLYEPDSAVIRADLVGLLAEQLDAWPIDDGLALLSADEPRHAVRARSTPSRRRCRPRPKAVREYLREHGVGRVQVRRHGVEIDVAGFRAAGAARRRGFRTVMLTRVLGRMVALVLAATISE